MVIRRWRSDEDHLTPVELPLDDLTSLKLRFLDHRVLACLLASIRNRRCSQIVVSAEHGQLMTESLAELAAPQLTVGLIPIDQGRLYVLSALINTRFNLGSDANHDSSLYCRADDDSIRGSDSENHNWAEDRPPTFHLAANGRSSVGLSLTGLPNFRAALLTRPVSFMMVGNAPDEPPRRIDEIIRAMDNLPTLGVLKMGVFWRLRNGVDEISEALSNPSSGKTGRRSGAARSSAASRCPVARAMSQAFCFA